VTTRTGTTRTAQTTQTATTLEPARALARCLEPVGGEDFLAENWQRKPLVVARDEPGRFHDLLSPADVELLVTSGSLRYPAFRLAKAGETLEVGSYTRQISWRPVPFTGTIDVERVLEEFERGATIVLQALHHNWPRLAELCRGLEQALGHPAQANAYFTPRSAQGLAVHHDTHDVFVLQISGEKHWRIYEPVLELPLKDQRYSKELGEPGEVVEDVTLAAGDTLYLPRGWLHEALTSDTESLHLTVGVNVYTWIDALRAAVDACADEVDLRRSVPASGAGGTDLLPALASRLAPEQVARRMRERLVRTRRPILDGQLGPLRALEELDPDTLVERRPTVIADTDGGALCFEGKRVRFPEHVARDVAFVASADEPFSASDLPGDLDEEGRLVFVRRLVREGFLRIRK
jgi:ribosomal protein L16 Arg81 hydroxylase